MNKAICFLIYTIHSLSLCCCLIARGSDALTGGYANGNDIGGIVYFSESGDGFISSALSRIDPLLHSAFTWEVLSDSLIICENGRTMTNRILAVTSESFSLETSYNPRMDPANILAELFPEIQPVVSTNVFRHYYDFTCARSNDVETILLVDRCGRRIRPERISVFGSDDIFLDFLSTNPCPVVRLKFPSLTNVPPDVVSSTLSVISETADVATINNPLEPTNTVKMVLSGVDRLLPAWIHVLTTDDTHYCIYVPDAIDPANITPVSKNGPASDEKEPR